MIRMHLNENPLVEQPYCRYPDPEYEQLRSLLRLQFGLRDAEVLLGNGSTEIISTIFLWAHLNHKKILFPWPSYILYQELEMLYNADVIRIQVGLGEWDVDQIAEAVPDNALLILCNPNNPTGRYMTRKDIRRLLSKLPASTTVVLDEAYIEYVDVQEESDECFTEDELVHSNCIIVRTFSKFYGLAGWRIGYALLHPELFRTLRVYLQLWNVNAPAIDRALACLHDKKRYMEGRRQTVHLREILHTALEQAGFSVLPSQTNFLCCTHPQVDLWTTNWRKEGYYVNHLIPYADSELKSYVRLSVENGKVMEKFIQLIKQSGGYDEKDLQNTLIL